MNLVRVKKESVQRIYSCWSVKADFLIARDPVTTAEFDDVMETAADSTIKTATWADAIRYCNRLNRKLGLPPTYDESAGLLINQDGQVVEDVLEVHGFRVDVTRVKGYRLPTLAEWECAAMGLGNPEGGFFLKILEKTHVIEGMDTRPVSVARTVADLEENPAGIRGVLGNAVEWCTDNNIRDARKNRVCFWQYYFTNYDNNISYDVQTRLRNDADVCRFRVVRTASPVDEVGEGGSGS